MIISNVSKKKKILTSEDLAWEYSQFKKADSVNRLDRIRANNNFMLYAPVDDWYTWSATSAEKLQKDGLPPNYYNFLQMYVEGNAGNFAMNKIDPEFVDRSDDSKNTQDTLYALKQSFYSDKEHFNYNAHHLSAIVNGCVALGIEEIKIIRTINEPRGRIAFKSLPSVSVIFDPNNLTDNIAGGSQHAWKRFYLLPRDMVHYFEDMTDDVRRALRARAEKEQIDYEDRIDYPIERMWGSQYEVIEHYHIETEYKYIAFDSIHGVRLPETPFEYGSQEDWFAKEYWAKSQGYYLDPSAIKEIKVPQEVLWITSYCPDLGIIFENRRDERQIIDRDGKAKLPFYTWSYITKNGKWTSLIDLGKNLQNDINHREAHKSKMFTQTPIGGKTFVHPLAFGDNDEKMREFTENYTDPSKPAFYDSDAPPGMRLVDNIQGTQLNPAIMMDENSKMTMMDRILRLPLAMQGVSKSGASGVLFGRQVIEGNIMQKVPATTLEQYELDKYIGWLSLAPNLYSGKDQQELEYNYNRTFETGQEKIILNEFVGISEAGEDIVKNNLQDLKNVDVVVSKSKDNDYMKQAKREMDISYLQSLAPNDMNMGFRAIAEADLAKNMDGLTPEQSQEIDEMSKLVIEISKKRLVMMNSQLDAQINPPPQPMPVGGGDPQGAPSGAPQEISRTPIPEGVNPQAEQL